MSVRESAAWDRPHVGAAFLVALSLHLGAVAAIAFWPTHSDEAPGEQEITIDLAPAMEAAEPVEAVATTAPAPDVPEEATPAEEVTEVQPEEQVPEVSDPQVVESVPTEDAVPAEDVETVDALPPEETVQAKTLEEKPKQVERKPPPQKIEREREPKPRREVAERRPAPSRIQPGQASSSRENTGGAGASGDPNVLNRYAAQLRAALRNRLRYPPGAQSAGIAGVATIRFTMHRSGRVISSSLVKSAGNAALDQAALATARAGSVLPAAPDALPQEQLTFSIPLQFNRR